jgi:adenylate kinase family enzyme
MRRVLILGCSGAGKSTFARQLGAMTGLPVVHLDQLYWQPGWVEPDRERWFSALRLALQCDAWILDGHFGSSISMRLEAADTVILFDFPATICIRRVLTRVLQSLGKTRPDMAVGCPERFDLKFLNFIWTFRKQRLPHVMKKLEGFRGELIILRKPSEVRDLLGRMQSASASESPGLA